MDKQVSAAGDHPAAGAPGSAAPAPAPMPATTVTSVSADPQRSWLKWLIILLLLIVSAAVVYLLSPKYRLKRYLTHTQKISNSLAAEISQLKSRSFNKASTRAASVVAAKKLISKHTATTRQTKGRVIKLRTEFKKLSRPAGGQAVEQELTKLFDQADTILDQQTASLKLRSNIIAAYGDLDRQLNRHLKPGGKDQKSRAQQAGKVQASAGNAVTKLKQLTVTSDEKSYYDLQLDYLGDTDKTFLQISQLLEANKTVEASQAYKQYSQRGAVRAKKVEFAITDYYKRSNLAQAFQKFTVQAVAVKAAIGQAARQR